MPRNSKPPLGSKECEKCIYSYIHVELYYLMFLLSSTFAINEHLIHKAIQGPSPSFDKGFRLKNAIILIFPKVEAKEDRPWGT